VPMLVDVDRALDGLQGAVELHRETVARRLDLPSLVGRGEGTNELFRLPYQLQGARVIDRSRSGETPAMPVNMMEASRRVAATCRDPLGMITPPFRAWSAAGNPRGAGFVSAGPGVIGSVEVVWVFSRAG